MDEIKAKQQAKEINKKCMNIKQEIIVQNEPQNIVGKVIKTFKILRKSFDIKCNNILICYNLFKLF